MKSNYIAVATLAAFVGMGLMPVQGNAQTTYPRPKEVNARLANQAARIKQGVKSGELSTRQAQKSRLAQHGWSRCLLAAYTPR